MAIMYVYAYICAFSKQQRLLGDLVDHAIAEVRHVLLREVKRLVPR